VRGIIDHRPLVLLLPDINLDAFKTCIHGRWRLGELLFANTAIAFGAPPTPDAFHLWSSDARCIVDVLAFSIILVRAKRSTADRYPGIPSILDTILRDSTVYFTFMFASQLLFQLFLFFAPVSDMIHPRGRLSCCAHRTRAFRWTSSSCQGRKFPFSSTPKATFERVIDIDLHSIGHARFSPRSWRRASCSL